MTRSLARLAGLLLAALFLAGAARAHMMPAGQGGLRLAGNMAYALVSLPAAALYGYDDNRDGLISKSEIDAHRGLLATQVSVMLDVRSGGVPGRVVFQDLLLAHPESAEAEVLVMRTYQWDAPVQAPLVRLNLFHADATAHAKLALTVLDGERRETALLTRSRSSHQFFQGPWAVFSAFAAAGAAHILEGPDHLLFLLTVLVAGAGWRYWLTVVTSFTVAHSITLALSALGYASAPASVVEPLIAASIVLLALDNLVRGQAAARYRPALVFACGLLHGLGISGALVEMGLPDGQRALGLLGFNAGVELGQLAFVAAALGVLALARKALPQAWAGRLPHAASVAAAGVGGWWLVARLVA